MKNFNTSAEEVKKEIKLLIIFLIIVFLFNLGIIAYQIQMGYLMLFFFLYFYHFDYFIRNFATRNNGTLEDEKMGIIFGFWAKYFSLTRWNYWIQFYKSFNSRDNYLLPL
jgi:hypothetical protein